MAEAIPKDEWSEVEEYTSRLFYWEYLVDRWLVPGQAVLQERQAAPEEPGIVAPTSRALQQSRWLKEPETIVEH